MGSEKKKKKLLCFVRYSAACCRHLREANPFTRGPHFSVVVIKTIGTSHFIGITQPPTMGEERLQSYVVACVCVCVCVGKKNGNGGGLSPAD